MIIRRLETSSHGGKRANSGRKKVRKSEPSHAVRPRITAQVPGHVVLKLRPGFPSLRDRYFQELFWRAVKRARELGLRVQQFAILSNHLHLIVECDSSRVLARAMTSICTTLAKGLGWGKIFAARYFVRLLRTPAQVRNAVAYVVYNQAKHMRVKRFVDAFSSAVEAAREILSPARSWLLNKFGEVPPPEVEYADLIRSTV